MEKDNIRLVPDNSFIDKVESCNSPTKIARRTLLPSPLATTSINGLDRVSRASETPPQSLLLTNSGVYSSANRLKSLTELSLSSKDSDTSLNVSSKLHHDMEMLRSGNSTLQQLKSRLYNRPSESEVFKTIDCAGTKQHKNKNLPHPPARIFPSKTPYKTTMLRKKHLKQDDHSNMQMKELLEHPVATPIDRMLENERELMEHAVSNRDSIEHTPLKESNDEVLWVIHDLRKRLGWPYRGIERGEQPVRKQTIDTTIKEHPDDGQFQYCVERGYKHPKARYNPYDLMITTANVIKNCKTYYTVSATYVTMVRKNQEPETIPVLDWLKERKSFLRIFKIRFFEQYRIRRTFLTWKHNIRSSRNSDCKSCLSDSLLLADTIFQKALLQVRSLCENACSSGSGLPSENEAISLVDTDWYSTMILSDFCDRQRLQVQKVDEKLLLLRKKVVAILVAVCKEIVAIEKERIEIKVEEKLISKSKMNIGNWNAKAKSMEHTKEKYGLLDNKRSDERKREESEKTKNLYKYTKQAEWRTVHKRLRSFVRCVDFLIMELLKRVVDLAVSDIVLQIETSINMNEKPEPRAMDWSEVKRNANKSHSEFLKVEPKIVPPMFELNLLLEQRKQSAKGKSARSRGTSPKPRKSVHFLPDSEPGESEEDSYDDLSDDGTFDNSSNDASERHHSKRSTSMSAISLNFATVRISPSYQDLESKFLDVVYQYEQSILTFTSLLKEPNLQEYIDESDTYLVLACDKEALEFSKAHEKPWPSIEQLFGNDDDYQKCISDIVQYISVEITNVEEYSKRFITFCDMVNEASRIDVDKSLEKREWTSEQFNAALSQFTDQIFAMEEMKVTNRVGMFVVKSADFRDTCLLFPRRIVSSIRIHLPRISCTRNEALLNTIKISELKLERPSANVEEFVQHLAFLARLSNDIPALEKEYKVVSGLFQVAIRFSLDFTAEEWALYRTLGPSFSQLKATILYCEAKKDENIEKFMKDLKNMITELSKYLYKVKDKVRSSALLDEDVVPQAAMENIRLLMEDVEIISQRTRNYAIYQDRFGDSISTAIKRRSIMQGNESQFEMSKGISPIAALQKDLTEVERDLTLRKLLWESMDEWEVLLEKWKSTQFEALKVDGVQNDVTRFVQTVFLLEKGLPPNSVMPHLKQKVINFKQGMPVISSLRNTVLKERHWNEIQEVMGTKVVRHKEFTLGDLLQLKIFQHKDRIAEISSQASNEATVEQMLQKVMNYWNSKDFQLVAHSNRDTAIVVGSDEIFTALEESQVTLSNIKGSRFSSPIKGLVDEWERKLNLFSRTFEEWMLVQRTWLYLETIFSAADIQRQLTNESRLFNVVDKNLKDIMRRVSDNPNALKASTAAGVLEVLQTCRTNLEKIHKSLEDYLETKRLVFARFYFLSNEELLDILSKTRNPAAVQPHLKKCFGNVKFLVLHIETKSIPNVLGMISEEDEHLPLAKNIRITGPVEQWLLNVEHTMFDTVKLNLKKAIADYDHDDYISWVLSHSGQVGIAVTQIMFSRSISKALASADPNASLNDVRDNLIVLLNQLASVVTKDLPLHQFQLVVALIIVLVHSRDIVKNLIDSQVKSIDDFAWTRHLRYDWDDDGNTCVVTQSLASFVYGYEYLGCSSRLVITPLTDRCYLTLTGAMHLNLGGAPAGPAGTGKTETVKDLAKAMGKQCLVFNCSEGLDFKMIGKILSGLAQSGSWCCFDEFNRIDIEVLSVVAQQLHSIKVAKDASAVRFFFEGRDIKLNPSCGAFITMNPGYAGRVDLPDNLKSLFRPVAMVVPDYALIAEIILFSQGFEDAASLSRKLVNLYELASKQLSQQDHYDFGLRAIKAVLVMAGQQHRTTSLEKSSHVLLKVDEANVLINAIKNANIPKFLSDDVILFERILADIFPDSAPPSNDHIALEKAIGAVLRELSYQRWPSQIEKIIQFNDTLHVRHGVMLVGPTGGGKSTVRKILRKALTVLPNFHGSEEDDTATIEDTESSCMSLHPVNVSKSASVDLFSVNPKCVTLGQLYGEVDENAMEWSDGLLAAAIRMFSKNSNSVSTDAVPDTAIQDSTFRSKSRKSKSETNLEPPADHEQKQSQIFNWQWIILDGPVDTLWVENLNTVLDDSKVLCLANGERISMNPSMRMIFEVDSLSQASPATISRCGMVYLDPHDLGWRPYVRSWLHKLREKKVPEAGRDRLLRLFEGTVDHGLRFVHEQHSFISIAAPPLSIVSTLCAILGAMIDYIGKKGGFGEVQGVVSDTNIATVTTPDLLPRSSSSHEFSFTNLNSKKQNLLEKNPSLLPQLFSKVFVFAYVWAFGGNFNCPSEETATDIESLSQGSQSHASDAGNARISFDSFVRDLFESNHSFEVYLPKGNTSLYNYYIDLEKGQFTVWENLVPSTEALIEKYIANQIAISDTINALDDPMPNIDEIETRSLIPTLDSVQYSFIVSLLALNNRPVLLTGDTGVGKSALLHDVLNRLSQEGGAGTGPGTILGSVLSHGGSSILESIVETSSGTDIRRKKTIFVSKMQFSAHTSMYMTRKLIESKLIKRGRDTLGAKPGKKVLIFVDDMNMPQPEAYGAQPPLELLRSFLDAGGFHESNRLQWKEVHGVNLLSACAPPGGGRHMLSPRLLRNLSVFCLPPPSTPSLHHIFGTIFGRYLRSREFHDNVKSMHHDIVAAAISIYHNIATHLRPTPSKCHFLFNLRDLSKLIHGLLQAHPSTIKTRENWLELTCHEAARVFYDRLTNEKDRKYFSDVVARAVKENFKVKWNAQMFNPDSLLFGDFLDLSAAENERVYRCIRDPTQLLKVLEDYRDRASISGRILNQSLVLFSQTVQHIARAARVFRQREGHMLLVGIGGSGKSSVAELAAYIELCSFIKPSLKRNYSHADFRDDLKEGYLQAGIQGQKTVLFLNDSLIVKEVFLEDICNLLNLSHSPEIFDEDDKEKISMELKKDAIEQGIQNSKEQIFEFFLSRVRSRLHIVFATSPSGSLFRQRCRMYPALINCCTIDWYDKWSAEALRSVAKAHLVLDDFCEDEEKSRHFHDTISDACVLMHQSVESASSSYLQELRRHFYVTPKSYIEFIQLYKSVLRDKRREYDFNLKRMSSGLLKVAEAKDLVAVMQEDLIKLGPVLEQRSKDTENLMVQLAQERKAVDAVRSVVQKEEDITDKEAKKIEVIAESARKDLEQALPQLQVAIEMLDALNKNDIVEVRAYSKPPTMVMTVMAAVCTLLGQKTDWSTAKLLLGEQGFLKRLVGYDRDSVTNRIYDRVKKITKHPDFNPTAIGKISKACKSMCAWVLALQNYTEVHRMVIPKQQRCQEAQEALSVAYENLRQKRAALKQVQDQLDSLQSRYDDSFAELELLKNKKEQSIVRLRRAAILTKSLADEEIRWRDSVQKLQKDSQGPIGNTLVAAASIAYSGAFTFVYRKNLLQKWHKTCADLQIPLSKDYNIIDYLTEPIRIQDWQNRGLPHDHVSVENAIFITNTHRWPYIIDPQSQAIRWIHELEADNNAKVIKASEMDFMKVLEPALRLGEPIIIEDASESLDPMLVPILDMNIKSESRSNTIKIGDTEIEYDPKFRLYILTQIANPQLLPEACIKVCVINFTVTFEGLQDQLLSNVVHQERPDLEVQRYILLESLVNDRMKLREIEDRTLDLLSTSIGNVLDDEDLINTLDNSKDMVNIIQKRLKDSQETERNIQRSRIAYNSVADRGAVLYFVVNDLSLIDVMYQFSLHWFTTLFSNCISTFDVSSDEHDVQQSTLQKSIPSSSRKFTSLERARTFAAKQRTKPHPFEVQRNQTMASSLYTYLETMVSLVTETVYRVVSQALFARHQVFFSFYLCARIHMSSGIGKPAIENPDWHCFLYGANAKLFSNADDSEASPRKEVVKSPRDGPAKAKGSMGQLMEEMMKSPAKWLAQDSWQECQHLSEVISAFSGICSHISRNPQFWLNFSNSKEPFKFLNEADKEQKGIDTLKSQQRGWSLSNLTNFQKMILIKVLKKEYLISSIRDYVISEMGLKFITPTGFDLHEFYDGSSCRTPLIFILSPGSDPTAELLRFTKEVRGSSLHLDMISLGRGQGLKAEELIRRAYSQKGKWVLLQNCHLAGSFMPNLREIVRSISNPDVDVDPQFRLWLSSKPSPSFPSAVLQAGLKMTVEPPPGVKANLQRSFLNIKGILAEKADKTNLESAEWKRILFGLCTFHAVVQERRKFGPLGWNVPYEFINSDLEVSVLSVYDLIAGKNEIPWKALKLLTGEIIYGGRVTDNWDQICLLSLLETFLNEDVLKKDFKYLSLESFKPPSGNVDFDDIVSYIEKFPSVDPPEIFGMHPNAEMGYLKDDSRKIIETLLIMRPRADVVVGQVKSSDDRVLDAIGDICCILPQKVQSPPLSRSTSVGSKRHIQSPFQNSVTQVYPSKTDTRLLTNEDANNSAMVAFLRQELFRYNNLLETVHTSLQALYSAVMGEIVMSEILEETYSSLLHSNVPHQWKIVAYSSTKPLASWIDNLIKRIDFIGRWIDIAKARGKAISRQQSRGASFATLESPSRIPRSFWLPAFYFPQGFLTAALQSHARKKNIAIDSLGYDYKVSNRWWCPPDANSDKFVDINATSFQPGDTPNEGMYVTGLFLDGAKWNADKNTLEESLTNQRFSPLPEVHFLPVKLEECSKNENSKQKEYSYVCPLYQTSSRASSLVSSRHTTNFISSVKLSTNVDPNHWTRRGVALLCQTDD